MTDFRRYLQTKTIAKARRPFYLRQAYIPAGRLGRVLDVVDVGGGQTIMLIDFGDPPNVVARIATHSDLVSLHTLDEITKAEHKRQRRRHWWQRIWPFRRRRKYYFYQGE